MGEPTYPGAVPPDRTRRLASLGIALSLSEWGDPTAPPVVLCHGGFDHARGFDLLAPLLARRFRVVALDQRGHGESGRADAYIWVTDVLDLVNVLRGLDRPAHLVGHRKGGGLAPDAALQAPEPDSWGPLPESIIGPRLANVPRLERATVAGAGHFVHVEQPGALAALLLDHLER